MSVVPGHSVVHATLWKGGPSQNAPPFSGAGLVQLRVRRCQPRPQRALHSDHSVHEDQPPLTGGRRWGGLGVGGGWGQAREEQEGEFSSNDGNFTKYTVFSGL